MATGNTTLLGLALPVEGELDGTWGDVVNDSITSLVDSAIAGTTTISADADVTLTTTNLAANQARQAVLLWTASNGVTTRNITAPARSKPYIVINAGTGSVVLRGAGPTTGITVVAGEKCVAAWNGSDFVKVATSVADGVTSVGGTGTVNGITLTGTVTSTGNLTLGGTLSNVSLTTQVTGTLPVANGGTGATSLTANNVLLGNGTSQLQVVAPGTSGNVLTSNGTTWTSAAGTAGDVTLNGTQTLTNKTFGDNPTFSAGTANGVAYLNGSKVLTTGSALTFNGTSFTNTVGTVSAAGFTSSAVGGEGGQLSLNNPTDTGSVATFDVSDATTARLFTTVNDALLQIGQLTGTGGNVAFFTAAAERMRLTSTGLGIGTSSPGSKLDVNGTITATGWSGGGVVTETATQTLTNKTTSGLVLNDGYTEEVFAVSGTTPALSPTDGSIQTWTLSGNSTPTAGTWAAGQSINLMVDDGTARTITWTSLAVTWETNGGTAPTLATSGFTVIVLWKVGSTIYGARVGDA
jgi:hypothetical protein